jgi:hypothetical protein
MGVTENRPDTDGIPTGIRWLNRAFRWAILATFLYFGLIAVALVLASLTGRGEDDVRLMIGQHLSAGASADEIYAYLDGEHIRHDSADYVSSDTDLQEAGYKDGVRAIAAWIDGQPMFYIYFILDSNDRLQGLVVKSHFISL